MIVFGKRAKVLGTEQIPSRCPGCGTTTRFLSVYQTYLHVMWVPTFPLPKSYILQCQQCQKVQKEKELQAVEKEQFRLKKGQYRTPIWFFTGLVLLAGLVGYMIYNEHQHKVETASYRVAPQPGDLYIIRLKGETDEEKKLPYRVLRLVDAQGDSYHFNDSPYGYRLSSDVDSHLDSDMRDKPDFFDKEPSTIPKALVEKLEVIRIIRK